MTFEERRNLRTQLARVAQGDPVPALKGEITDWQARQLLSQLHEVDEVAVERLVNESCMAESLRVVLKASARETAHPRRRRSR